jgi:hypothetical protein
MNVPILRQICWRLSIAVKPYFTHFAVIELRQIGAKLWSCSGVSASDSPRVCLSLTVDRRQARDKAKPWTDININKISLI